MEIEKIDKKFQEMLEDEGVFFNGSRHEGLSMAIAESVCNSLVSDIASLVNGDEDLRHVLDEPDRQLDASHWKISSSPNRIVNMYAKTYEKKYDVRMVELRIYYV